MRRLALALLAVAPVVAVSLPARAGIEIECEATLASLKMSHPQLNCSCPCAHCQPDCTSGSSSGSRSGSQGSGLTLSQAVATQVLGTILDQALASIFAPPKDNSAELAAQRAAAEAAQRQFEAQQQQLRDLWKIQQAQAARQSQAAQAQRQQQGQDLLAQMQGIEGTSSGGSTVSSMGGTLEGFKWESGGAAKVAVAPISTGRYDTSGLKSWQRLLCAAYFSENAVAAMGSNPEQARFLNDQAARATAGQAVDVPCKFASPPAVPDPSVPDEKTMKAIETVQLRLKDLQGIEAKVQHVREEKKGAEEQVHQAETARAQAESDKAQVKPDDTALLAEIERRLAEAQAQLDDANRKLQALAGQEDSLREQKDSIRKELEEIQRQQQGNAAPRP